MAPTRPAHQRLDPHHPGCREFHHRLVLETKLARCYRGTQLAGHLEPAHHVRVHVRGEDLHPAATGIFGPGHGHVGVAQQVPGGTAAGERHTDARGQRNFTVRDMERLGGDGPAEALGDVDDLWSARGALNEHGELVAAPPGHGVLGRDRSTQAAGCLGEQQVARAVPDRVVDPGEAVQVQEDRSGLRGRPVRVGRRGAVDRILCPVFHVCPVRQPGEPVVVGEVRDLPAQRYLVADIACGDQQPVRCVHLAVPGHDRLDVPPGSVGRSDAAGEPVRLTPAASGADDPGPGGAVFRVDELGQRPALDLRGRVAVLADARAREPDDPVAVTDEHDVAGAARELPEPLLGFLRHRGRRTLLPQQLGDPGDQRERGYSPAREHGRLGERFAGQRPADRHGRGDARDQRRQQGCPRQDVWPWPARPPPRRRLSRLSGQGRHPQQAEPG